MSLASSLACARAAPLKSLRMVAAVWGACYPAEREFATQWSSTGATLTLADAADSGSYSLQIEGALVRLLLHVCSAVPASALPAFPLDAPSTLVIGRHDWKREQVSPEDWDQLQWLLYEAFYDDGAGFFAADLVFADKAIALLRSGAQCLPGSCAHIDDDDRRRSACYAQARTAAPAVTASVSEQP